ncbi:dihydrolipoyllysine-residue succinyltransferase component of 2-oxoglutarate dehydrogenase complex, mitochondrial-like [Drosophila navojoa]|nr:dihydrolipoyllysine-residue succinyltransferase component of 2-oxoglutarate dehydrogenase complex, mitochondrial-like [Drosophila navojoa]
MSAASILKRSLRRNIHFLCLRSGIWNRQLFNRHCSRMALGKALYQPHKLLCLESNTALRFQDVVGYLEWKGFHTTSVMWSEQVVKVPPFPDSISEGDIKFTCKVGDSFAADDAVMEIETDKTTMPVQAPFAGVVTAILVKSGDTVKSGQEVFKMKPGAAPAKAAAAPAAAAPAPAPAPAAPAPAAPKPAPAPAPAPAAAAPKPAPAPPAGGGPPPIKGTRTETKVKMSRMRLKIAARLKDAQNTCAMLTTFNEIDMSFVMQFRKENLDAFMKKNGVKLGFMSIFSKATSNALQDQPVVNAVIADKEIIYRDYVDISVAVASPRGLVVPVIRGVESMKYADIEKTLGALADKAKRDAITIEDMDGGTFTISNGGVFGSLMGTPIINPPQSAILGMHGIVERPIAVKGEVKIRPMMYVALTYDHRIIDGREAVLFLRKIKSFVETPAELATGL